ncbi:MAG TPA: alpha/beta fold hydrolase [Thermomicrobiales bacterium]|nr:alpha/beta fold hydrolase [Thermomicrobiales bacterium]
MSELRTGGAMSGRQTGATTVETWRLQLTTAQTGNGRVAYLDAGSGDTVVMLHGIPTHSYVWRDVSSVVSIGHRVIVPDLAGFGFSEMGDEIDLSPAAQADALMDLLGECDVESLTLVGHDYGALVACELVRRAPDLVERLVLTNTSLRHEDWSSTSPLNPLTLLKLPGIGEAALKVSRPFMLKQAFALYVAERVRLDDDTVTMYWTPFEHGFDRTLLRISREVQLDEDVFHEWKRALHDFTRPSLVVWGALDPTFRPDRGQEIARLLPGSRFELFLHSNHFIQEDRPRALGRLIAAFVEGRIEP